VFCNPRQLAFVSDAVPRLAKALHLDPRELDKALAAKKMQYFAWVKRRVSSQESAAALGLGLPGVSVRKEPRRVYPNGELASTVIGHAGLEGHGLDGWSWHTTRLCTAAGWRSPASMTDSDGICSWKVRSMRRPARARIWC